MDPRIVTSVVSATRDIFNTMVAMEVKEGEVAQDVDRHAFDLSGIIGLSGPKSGVVGVYFPRAVAANVAGKMLGMTVDESSAEAKDTVSELTNMIAGGMRNELAKHGIAFDISIPTVVAGNNYSTEVFGDAPHFAVPFQVEGKTFVVEVFMKDQVPPK